MLCVRDKFCPLDVCFLIAKTAFPCFGLDGLVLLGTAWLGSRQKKPLLLSWNTRSGRVEATIAFPSPTPHRLPLTTSPYNSSFLNLLCQCQLLFLVASLVAIDKKLPDSCTRMMSFASSSQSVARDRCVQSFACAGDCPLPHEILLSKAAA